VATENLYISGLAADDPGSLTGASAAFGSTSGTWTTNTDNSSWEGRFELDNPTDSPDATQSITVTIRARHDSGNNPTIDSVAIRNGTTQRGINSTGWSVSSTTGQDIVVSVSCTGLTGNGADLSLVIVTTAQGGSPSSRSAVQIDYAKVDVTTTPAGPSTFNDFVSVLADATSTISDTLIGTAPEIVQQKAGTSDASSVSVTLDSTPTSGNYLIAIIAGSLDLTSVPSGFTQDYYVHTGATDWNMRAAYSKVSDGTETGALTFTTSGTDALGVTVYEVANVSGFDVGADAWSSKVDATTQTTGTTATTAVAKSIAFAVALTWRATDYTPTLTNSFTLDEDFYSSGATGWNYYTALKSLTATGTVETTWGAIDGWQQAAVFVYSGPAGTTHTDDVSVVADATSSITNVSTLATQALSVLGDGSAVVVDAATLGEVLSVLLDGTSSIVDSRSLDDALAVLLDGAASVADQRDAVDALSALLDSVDLVVDAHAMGDVLAVLTDGAAAVSDSRSINQSLTVTADGTSTAADTMTAVEALSALGDLAAQLVQTVAISEAVSVQVDAAAVLEDLHTIGEVLQVLADATTGIFDEITSVIQEFLSVLADATSTVADAITAAEAVVATVDGTATVADTRGAVDDVAVLLDGTSTVTGTLSMVEYQPVLLLASDAVAVQQALAEALLSVADALAAVTDAEVMVDDTAGLADVLIGLTDWLVPGTPPPPSEGPQGHLRARSTRPTPRRLSPSDRRRA